MESVPSTINCLEEYFQFHISKMTVCENCGLKIRNPDAKNVAHILPKSKLGGFPEVKCHKSNALHLCTHFDSYGRGCHNMYDSSWSEAMAMPVWETAKLRFVEFKHLITKKSIVLLNFE